MAGALVVGCVLSVLFRLSSGHGIEEPPLMLKLSRQRTWDASRSIRVPSRLRHPVSNDHNASGIGGPEPLELSTDNSVDLLNMGNTQYSGTVYLGTPPQPLKVLMDTGSSDLWFFQGRFIDTASSTLQKSPAGDVRISYGQGFVQGYLATDVLQICPSIALQGQSFLVPTTSKGMDTVQADGVLGLALPMLSHTGETVLQKLTSQAGISMFTLVLTGTVEGSVLAFGMPDKSWYAGHELTWVPATTGMWWAIDASLKVEGASPLTGSFLLDSGTSYIGLPEPECSTLINNLLPNGQVDKCRLWGGTGVGSGIHICPCSFVDTAKTIELEVGGVTYPISPSNFFGRMDEEGKECVVEVMPTSPGMPWILGDTVLRTMVAVFDSSPNNGGPRIGLAPQAAPQAYGLTESLQPPWWQQPMFGFTRSTLRLIGWVMLSCSLGCFIFHPEMGGPTTYMVVQRVCGPCFGSKPADAKVLPQLAETAEYCRL